MDACLARASQISLTQSTLVLNRLQMLVVKQGCKDLSGPDMMSHQGTMMQHVIIMIACNDNDFVTPEGNARTAAGQLHQSTVSMRHC